MNNSHEPFPDNESFPDSELPGGLSELEQHLRQQPLGELPLNRDEILYRCAYEAGAKAMRLQERRAVRRWQGVSIAASLLLACSVGSQIWLRPNTSANQPLVVEGQDAPGHLDRSSSDPANGETSTEDAAQPWSELWAERRAPASSALTPTTAIGMRQTNLDVTIPPAVLVPTTDESNGTPLQPKDFPLFLRGDV